MKSKQEKPRQPYAIRLSEDEREKIEQAAAAAKRKPSEWIRDVLMQAAKKVLRREK